MKVCHGNFVLTNKKNITKKMKRFLSLIIVIIAIALPSIAKNAKDDSSSKPIVLDISQNGNHSDHQVHRAPIRINIDAFYDSENNSINICYDGEATGEVYLYLNGDIVDYSSEINSTFQIHTTGMYKIEIHCGSWLAEGYLNL